jgi:uncharacterized protein YaiL (DUF2058 family)
MRFCLTLLLTVVILAAFTFTGCTKYATQEQMDTLGKTKESALSAEKLLDQKKAERMEWEKKVAMKEKEREAKKAEKAEIEDHLKREPLPAEEGEGR